MPADLVAQGRFEHGDVEFLLAEQGELAAVLQPQEVRQPGRADAFGAGGEQQEPVDGAEPCRIVAEHGTGQDIPAATVRTRAIQVGHFRQHTGRRAREQPGQRRHRLRCLMCGAPAEMPVIHQERSRKAQQRLDGQERHLPAALNRAPHQKRPELITGLADRQVQVISKVSHAVRVLSEDRLGGITTRPSSGTPARNSRTSGRGEPGSGRLVWACWVARTSTPPVRIADQVRLNERSRLCQCLTPHWVGEQRLRRVAKSGEQQVDNWQAFVPPTHGTGDQPESRTDDPPESAIAAAT